MPPRRSRLPDYFSGRGRGRGRGRGDASRFTGSMQRRACDPNQNADHAVEDDVDIYNGYMDEESYAVQAPKPYGRGGAPQQWLQHGMGINDNDPYDLDEPPPSQRVRDQLVQEIAPFDSPPTRRNLAGRFSYHTRRSTDALQQVSPAHLEYSAQTPMYELTGNTISIHPRTPLSSREPNNQNCFRRQPEGQAENKQGQVCHPSNYDESINDLLPVRQQSRGRQQFHALARPTTRYSSPSLLDSFQNYPPPKPIGRRANPAPVVGAGSAQLISPQTLDKKFQPIFPYEYFNAVQSSCFPSVYGSSYNVVVAAPTGSGKTVIFELAICRLIAQSDKKQDFKVVYQAPTKALCSERVRDWQAKFKGLGLQVAEFTGDSSAIEVRRVRTASIIITTPEKWDSITRKWSDHCALLKSVKLVLIDEVHILKDMRGATLEVVVSRMKSLGSEVRFVALSATMLNSNDIAQWLGLTYTSPQVPAKSFVFGEEFRPVRLERIVLGYNQGCGGNEHSFDSTLDDQLPNVIVKYSQGKPILVFCFTRKSAESAATILAEYWETCSPDQKPWAARSVTIQGCTRLQHVAARGVAFHHGGLERQDRDVVEAAFMRGDLAIVCCTSTLAVGVNLPCHTVILKGTTGYQNGKFGEYDEFEIMQMIGRAGRPQFDSSAVAIILTRVETQEKYKNLSAGTQTVESTLHLNLIEHLNSETALGTISSLTTAIRWLKGTFLAVRLRQNPNHYQLIETGCHARTADDQLEEICKVAIHKLADVGLIKQTTDDIQTTQFHGTEYGRAMSTYMVRFDTMEMILGMPKNMSMEQLLNALCRAPEFNEFRLKSTERPLLREVNKTQDIPFKFQEVNITETWQKISLLLQVELSKGTIPYQQRIFIETKQAIECMQRLLESYIECMIADKDAHDTKTALEFSRSLNARAWEGHYAQLCQVPDIGPANMKKLLDKQILSVLEFANLSQVTIGRFLSKNPPAAMKIVDALRSFPRLALDGHVTKSPRNGKQNSLEVQNIAKVTFGYTNDSGLLRWKNKVPKATFFAATSGGVLVHIWRGRLQEKQHEIAFPVQDSDAYSITCYITCDEIVGTIQSKKLSYVDVPHNSMAQSCSKNTDREGTAPSREAKNTERQSPTKRQKMLHYPSQPIYFGETVVDCIDLSAVDEEEKGSALSYGTYGMGTTARARRKKESTDSSSLLSGYTQVFSECNGEGTAQNPWTLDDSSTEDDFDTDIFDDIELCVIKESPKQSTRLQSVVTRATSGEICQSVTATEESFRDNRSRARTTDTSRDVPCSLVPLSPAPISATAPLVSDDPREVVSEETENITITINEETNPDVNSYASPPKIDMMGTAESSEQGERIHANNKREENPITAAPSNPVGMKEHQNKSVEPVWLAGSDKEVIDFLRGHVKFI